MRNVIIGAVGVLWGGGVLLAWALRGAPVGGGAFGAGQVAGLVLGVLLLVAGLYFLGSGLNELQARSAPTRSSSKRKHKRRPDDDEDQLPSRDVEL